MVEFVNPILTIILIFVYWYNTKIQNSKIKAQSDIISDLKDHLKFFDINKIKEYVELRESEKDKLMDLTRATLEKEFEIREKQAEIRKPSTNVLPKEFSNVIGDLMTEPYSYITKSLIFKSNEEIETILNKDFPKNKELIRTMLNTTRNEFVKRAGVSDFSEVQKMFIEKKLK